MIAENLGKSNDYALAESRLFSTWEMFLTITFWILAIVLVIYGFYEYKIYKDIVDSASQKFQTESGEYKFPSAIQGSYILQNASLLLMKACASFIGSTVSVLIVMTIRNRATMRAAWIYRRNG